MPWSSDLKQMVKKKKIAFFQSIDTSWLFTTTSCLQTIMNIEAYATDIQNLLSFSHVIEQSFKRILSSNKSSNNQEWQHVIL